MFLSKITLQSSNQMARELMRLGPNGPYASHQLLWQLFTEHSERSFLFREESDSAGRPEFYVLSKTAPEQKQALFNIRTKCFQPVLVPGQRLAYRLRVNPTISVKDPAGNSKRHDVLMHAKFQARKKQGCSDAQTLQMIMHQAAHAWISNEGRLQQWGMRLDVLPDIERYTQHRSRKKSGHQLQFSSVDFHGVLAVTDVDRFLTQYACGYGKSKALGCGLMLIRPA